MRVCLESRAGGSFLTNVIGSKIADCDGQEKGACGGESSIFVLVHYLLHYHMKGWDAACLCFMTPTCAWLKSAPSRSEFSSETIRPPHYCVEHVPRFSLSASSARPVCKYGPLIPSLHIQREEPVEEMRLMSEMRRARWLGIIAKRDNRSV